MTPSASRLVSGTLAITLPVLQSCEHSNGHMPVYAAQTAPQEDFDLVETISKGSFGTVYKAVKKGESNMALQKPCLRGGEPLSLAAAH